jgi:hypothetical protein
VTRYNNKRNIISVPKVYDWVSSEDNLNIKVTFQCKCQCKNNIIQADTYQYYTLSDGIKSVYNNEDELKEYGNRGILDPAATSYINLFINGILQPQNQYRVEPGELILTSSDLPEKGCPIILQFVTFNGCS